MQRLHLKVYHVQYPHFNHSLALEVIWVKGDLEILSDMPKESQPENLIGSGNMTPSRGSIHRNPSCLSHRTFIYKEAIREWTGKSWYYYYHYCPTYMYVHFCILLSYFERMAVLNLNAKMLLSLEGVAELANNLLISDVLHLVNYLIQTIPRITPFTGICLLEWQGNGNCTQSTS